MRRLLLLLSLLVPRMAFAADVRASFDTLLYADDDRVTVVSPQVTAAASLDDDGGQVSARATVDAVSAASVDVISNATEGFHEVRTAGALAVSHRLGAWLPELRLTTSIEPDYHSYGAGAGFERRLGSADTVLHVGYDVLYDQVGRRGTSFDAWSRTLVTHAFALGLTQNLDERTVVRATYDLTVQDGYQAKPYRFVPLFDQAGLDAAADQGVELGLASFDAYRLSTRPPEAVPELRVRHAFAVRGLRWLPALGASLRADYRYYVDSWAMQAHTFELALAVPLPAGLRLTATNRAHYQTSASFWARTYLVDGTGALPRYRTMDRDLSEDLVDTASIRLDWQHGAWRTYVDVGGQYSRFFDFLLLDARSALLLQVGVRYQP